MVAAGGPGPRRAIAFALLLPLFPAGVLAQSGAPSTPSDSVVKVVVARARELRRQGQRDSAYRVVTPLLDPALRAGLSPRSRLDVMQVGWALRTELGDARGGAEMSQAGLPLARELRDSTAMISALYNLGLSRKQLGRIAEARAAMTSALALSRRRHDAAGVVTSLNALASLELESGRLLPARRGFVDALREARAARDSTRIPTMMTNIATTWSRAGEIDSARAWYRRSLQTAREYLKPRAVALALQRLAGLDVQYGDPSRALEQMERASRTLHSVGIFGDALTADADRGQILHRLGRSDEARSLADSVLAAADRMGNGKVAGEVGNLLGRIALEGGAPSRAAAEYRRVLARGDVASVSVRFGASAGLARSLMALDSLGAAAAALAPYRAPASTGISRLNALQASVVLAEIEQRRGHWNDALVRCRLLEQDCTQLGEPLALLGVLLVRARCEQALGLEANATRTLDRALAVWESRREQATDPAWRERFATLARDVVSERLRLERLATGPSAAGLARALAVVERYKARTLQERIHAPGPWPAAKPAPAFEAAAWRRAALGPQDLFLECFAGHDTTWIFALTRDEIRLYGLGPVRGEFGRRIDRLHRAVARRPEDSGSGSALIASGSALGNELLGPVADLVRSHRRLIVSPDDRLALVPFALLSVGQAPLAATHALASTPSAAALSLLRHRGAATATAAGSRVFAFAGPGFDDGRPLPGSRAEIALMRRYYTSASILEGQTTAGRLALPGFDGLHFAAHAVVSDQAPWSSGILLAKLGDGDTDPFLRAATVASMRLRARLAVLSGCETAGGAIVSGEGVLGLAGAFLSAGVSAVTASLWKVDDRAAAALMEPFYEALSGGETVAAALRLAQDEVRRAPATAHPYYWAGFTVVGDPDARLPGRRAPAPEGRRP